MSEVTRWLNSSTASSNDKMFAGLYAEFHGIARARMGGEREGHTLNATALVHEARVRLEKSAPKEWRDRKHFYGAAAEAMRRILVEAARRRLAAKRGNGQAAVPIDDDLPLPAPLPDERLRGVHEMFDQLEKEHPMDSQIVEQRFFGGLTQQDISVLLDVCENTVQRHWTMAKTWLYRALSTDDKRG